MELTNVAATGGMIIEDIRSSLSSLATREVLYRLEHGVRILSAHYGGAEPGWIARTIPCKRCRAARTASNVAGNVSIDLSSSASVGKRPRLADRMLLMLDRVDGFWPDAGAAGLGQVRAVKDIDASAWFFKAHFFQDPVQPGSLGTEAVLQVLQFYMLRLAAACRDGWQDRRARFEPIALELPHRWKYRGQVLPHHRQVHTTLEVTETGRDGRGAYAIANASLWADGQRIYEFDRDWGCASLRGVWVDCVSFSLREKVARSAG